MDPKRAELLKLAKVAPDPELDHGEGPGSDVRRLRAAPAGGAARWRVYLLRCADGSYYTGVTNNVMRRLAAHRAGTASKYTRCRLPVRLACTLGSWPTPGPALTLEARIKAMTRREKQELIRRERAGP
jgi:putative endonuclease